MTVEVRKEFTFHAAHWLPKVPAGHQCGRLHGHSYRVVVRVRGALDEDMGWVVDFGDIKTAFDEVDRQLDHACLNDVTGLENPTCERLAIWIWDRLVRPLPGLSTIEVFETATSGCAYSGK